MKRSIINLLSGIRESIGRDYVCDFIYRDKYMLPDHYAGHFAETQEKSG